jgi:rubrerythrin
MFKFDKIDMKSIFEGVDEDEEDDSEIDIEKDPLDLFKDGDDDDDDYDADDDDIAALETLIESESEAISDYTRALNETKSPNVRRVYEDILAEEGKHLQQLLYLKGKLTGDNYTPKDPSAKSETDSLFDDDDEDDSNDEITGDDDSLFEDDDKENDKLDTTEEDEEDPLDSLS